MTEQQPDFTFDDIYISPFRRVRHFDDDGLPYYSPVERNLRPTRVAAIDQLVQSLTNGHASMSAFARRLGCSPRDVSGFVRCFSGMSGEEFRQRYLQRLVDDLLRYTSLSVAQVAERSGLGCSRTLIAFTRRLYGCTPVERRRRIRKAGDEGRFALD